MRKTPGWFGGKTLYRWIPTGRPVGTDGLYSGDVTLVEERVIVVRAGNADQAIRAAEREAKRYARIVHRNPYGQRVRIRYLGYVDAYIMCDELRNGAEIFSETEVVSRAVSDRTVVARQIGQDESDRKRASRRNILDIVFEKSVPGVQPTRKELAFRNSFTRGAKR